MIIVLKLGGNSIAGAEVFAPDLATIADRGDRLMIIHGGGPQTTALMRDLGHTPNVVGGRRITDAAALDSIKMMVGGKLNTDLCSLLQAAGVRAVGVYGAIEAVRRPPRIVSGCGDEPVDFGEVGDVTGVKHRLIESLWDAGFVPVVPSIGTGENGEAYNINADIVATNAAAALKADRAVLLTDKPGVLRDKDDPSTRIATMNVSEGRQLIVEGVVVAGMIPKLEESFKAIAAGVDQVQIVGQLAQGELQSAIDNPGSVGTVIST